MIPAIRRQKLLELITERGTMLLPEIIAAVGNSESTVRRDLKALEAAGEVELLRGGCVKNTACQSGSAIRTKIMSNRHAKEKIAKTAAAMIEPGDVVFLDDSSANFFLIDCLTQDNILVVTNSVANISKLIEKSIPCIMVGGQVKCETSSCIGPMAETAMKNLRFSKCFLGANGIDVHAGITNHDPHDQAIKLMAIKNSVQVYFLIESAKSGNVDMCSVAEIGDYTIITDETNDEMAEMDNIIIAE